MNRRMEREKKTVSVMIGMYCRSHHKDETGLCAECTKLEQYAFKKIDRCPFHELKPVCAKCRVHCYQEEMRGDIKNVMRYSGPQMLFAHPVMGIRYIYHRFRS